MGKDFSTERERLRKEIISRRNAIPTSDIYKKSGEIHARLWGCKEFSQALNIFIYVNFRSEVETIPLIKDCLKQGKKISVPLTIPGQGLEAYEINNPARDLRPGFCSIPEPDPKRLVRFPNHEIDIVILPGSVFDENGGRLGYGGGYYDKFLTYDAPSALRLGIAFELQVVKELPLLPHDQQLDFLVTEKRLLRFNR